MASRCSIEGRGPWGVRSEAMARESVSGWEYGRRSRTVGSASRDSTILAVIDVDRCRVQPIGGL